MKFSRNCQPLASIDAISFDCDGTLSAIEGIDELAEMNQVGAEVKQLTEAAMAESGLNQALYQKRLDLVRPTHEQLEILGKQYLAHVTPDTQAVIQLLLGFNKTIYVLSAGIYQAVASFVRALQVPEENVYAVKIAFDNYGNYLNFDETSPLILNDGKKIIGKDLIKKTPRIIHIGDGLNDYSMHEILVRFIGYGGIFYREKVAALCDFYIREKSMACILPLCLTASEVAQLQGEKRELYEKGWRLMQPYLADR